MRVYVQTLLMLNAPLRPRTPDEDTPRELAARYKQKEVMELLGESLLQAARWEGNVALCELFWSD